MRGVALQLLPQAQDVHVDSSGGRHVIVSPHLLQQLKPRQDDAPVPYEIPEQIEFPGRQFDWLSGAHHHGLIERHAHLAESIQTLQRPQAGLRAPK
jgi:hypothetical protein